jgi:hypothetical protein
MNTGSSTYGQRATKSAGRGFVQPQWLALLVGACSSVLTELTGFLDWRTISSRTPLKRTATLHAATMASASVVFVHGMRVCAEPRATRLRDAPAIETYRAGDPEARAKHHGRVERGA